MSAAMVVCDFPSVGHIPHERSATCIYPRPAETRALGKDEGAPATTPKETPPDLLATALRVVENLWVTPGAKDRFASIILASLAQVQAEERGRCARIAETWGHAPPNPHGRRAALAAAIREGRPATADHPQSRVSNSAAQVSTDRGGANDQAHRASEVRPVGDALLAPHSSDGEAGSGDGREARCAASGSPAVQDMRGGAPGQDRPRDVEHVRGADVAAAPAEPGASATPLDLVVCDWAPNTPHEEDNCPNPKAATLPPAQPAEPRRPAIVIRPPQEQLGKEGVEAAPEVAPQPPSAGRRLWETRNDPPLPGLVDALRVADEAFADETEPHAFEPDPTCKVCGDPPDAAAHVAHGAPPSTAGAAAVPEAGALAEIDFVADWLAVTCPEPANRLRRARRALSSPSGDARPPEDEREDCPARLLVERSVYYCTLNAGHKRLHHEAHGGGGLIVSWVDDLSENPSPVAPSIPEEPKPFVAPAGTHPDTCPVPGSHTRTSCNYFREQLARYGHHQDGCTMTSDPTVCSCGFLQALAAKPLASTMVIG